MNAVTVAYLVHDYTLVLSSDELSTLSEALLPGLEMSGQSTCIDNMEAVFSQTFHNIPDVLMYVAKRNLKVFNASWLCSMPLIHFLSKQCYPGEKPSEDTKHDHHRPYWWGIPDRDHNYKIDSEKESFKKEIESFKGKIVDSDVLQDMVGRMKPYFEMDYLLPRVLMASLKLEQLPVVAKTGYISTDIILASLCFYVKTEKDISKNSLKETAIKECLTVVKNKFSEENYEKSVEFLKCAWRSFMIAADVLTSMKDRGNKLTDTVIGLALDAFLISLHVFTLDNSNKEFIDKTACMGSYETTFDAVKGDIRSVLNEQMKWSKEKELLACLKSWDRMMNVSVPPGLIRDQFTMFIKESLHKSMKDKILDEKLVKVYCQSQNIFCDAMVEVLATFVSDAVVKCSSNTLHISKWSEEQLSKYGRLLSVVFERHIYINQDIFKDLTSILQFRLETWKPFPIYVKMCNNYASNLSESCLSSMKEFQTFIECVIQRIFDRTITMEHLHIIEENQEYFFKILKDILPVIDTKVLKNTMKLRIADMNEFKDCMENLRCFIDICHHSEDCLKF
ncbi:Hypothetical predicted protein [Mytilus galloprovincialis]|nr:Hypothetical predicted protein [Mytilus galloprovincialis]